MSLSILFCIFAISCLFTLFTGGRSFHFISRKNPRTVIMSMTSFEKDKAPKGSNMILSASFGNIEAHNTPSGYVKIKVTEVKDENMKGKKPPTTVSESEFLSLVKKRLVPYDLPEEFYEEVLLTMKHVLKQQIFECNVAVQVPHLGTFLPKHLPSREMKKVNSTDMIQTKESTHMRFTPLKEYKKNQK